MGCGEWGEEQPFSAEKTATGVIMKETYSVRGTSGHSCTF